VVEANCNRERMTGSIEPPIDYFEQICERWYFISVRT
jgi:hypothetical protein